MEDGWEIIKKQLERKIDFNIKLCELFILTISAGVVVISLSEYKLIIISILMQIVSLLWLLIVLLLDLQKKMDKRSIDEFVKNSNILTIPFGLNQFIPILLYIISIGIMGIIILLPYLKILI